ncbi:MAG: hypothetical protein FWC55_01390 [Firmicutes bacterium]|nr:hypothetical protein [Bacillota bacterium]
MGRIVLSSGDIMLAAVLAFFITWFITNLIGVLRALFRAPAEIGFRERDLSRILDRCYMMFPREVINFRGQVYKRGMTVRVKTVRNKIYEGRLIGLNSENVLCVLTATNIIAHELDKIEDMSILA